MASAAIPSVQSSKPPCGRASRLLYYNILRPVLTRDGAFFRFRYDQRILSDRTVLLTGGTGFYGQGLTAKILRYLPSVRRLYLVLRPGRGPNGAALPVEERLDELFKLVVFDRFRQEEPAAFAAVRQKVRASPATCGSQALG